MQLHPSGKYLSLQTNTELARIILAPLPLRSCAELTTLYTFAEQSDFSSPRHAWLPDGSAVAVTSDDGIVRIVDLNGTLRTSIRAHGAAAPVDPTSELVGQALKGRGANLVKAQKESIVGSSVVKDLCVLPDKSIVSVGFDRTIRVAEVSPSA